MAVPMTGPTIVSEDLETCSTRIAPIGRQLDTPIRSVWAMQGRGEPFFVIHLVDEWADAPACFSQVLVLEPGEASLLVKGCSPQPDPWRDNLPRQ